MGLKCTMLSALTVLSHKKTSATHTYIGAGGVGAAAPAAVKRDRRRSLVTDSGFTAFRRLSWFQFCGRCCFFLIPTLWWFLTRMQNRGLARWSLQDFTIQIRYK